MATIAPVKCACESCQCSVDPSTAITKDGSYYCCDACANGHANGSACGNSGCTCHE